MRPTDKGVPKPTIHNCWRWYVPLLFRVHSNKRKINVGLKRGLIEGTSRRMLLLRYSTESSGRAARRATIASKTELLKQRRMKPSEEGVTPLTLDSKAPRPRSVRLFAGDALKLHDLVGAWRTREAARDSLNQTPREARLPELPLHGDHHRPDGLV